MRRTPDNQPGRFPIASQLLAAALLVSGGCGEVELSRPKPRQFEPKKQAASPRPPSASASRPAPSRPPSTATAPDPQRQIKQALRVIHNPEATEDTAAQAVDRLAFHKAAGLPELRKLLNDPRPKVRIKAVLAVARVGDRSDGDRLAHLMKTDPLLGVRSWAAHGIGRLRAEKHMGVLVEGLMDPEARVRQMSYKSIHDLAGFSYAFDPQATADLREKQVVKFRENLAWLKSQAVKRTALLEQAERNRQKSQN